MKIIVWMMILITPVLAANPFQLGKVEYFISNNKSLTKQFSKAQDSIDWREPLINADGSIEYHLPPPPVITFLDEPTDANAQLYLDWQKEKLDRIAKAQEVLDRLQKKDQP